MSGGTIHPANLFRSLSPTAEAAASKPAKCQFKSDSDYQREAFSLLVALYPNGRGSRLKIGTVWVRIPVALREEGIKC